MTVSTIALPFSFGTGYVVDTSDPNRQAAQNIIDTICTRIGERIFRPDYGTSVYESMLGPVGAPKDAEIEDEVRQGLAKFHKEIRVHAVSVRSDENVLRVNVQFFLPDISEEISLATAELPL